MQKETPVFVHFGDDISQLPDSCGDGLEARQVVRRVPVKGWRWRVVRLDNAVSIVRVRVCCSRVTEHRAGRRNKRTG